MQSGLVESGNGNAAHWRGYWLLYAGSSAQHEAPVLPERAWGVLQQRTGLGWRALEPRADRQCARQAVHRRGREICSE